MHQKSKGRDTGFGIQVNGKCKFWSSHATEEDAMVAALILHRRFKIQGDDEVVIARMSRTENGLSARRQSHAIIGRDIPDQFGQAVFPRSEWARLKECAPGVSWEAYSRWLHLQAEAAWVHLHSRLTNIEGSQILVDQQCFGPKGAKMGI